MSLSATHLFVKYRRRHDVVSILIKQYVLSGKDTCSPARIHMHGHDAECVQRC